MLRRLVGSALKFRLVVAALAALLVAFGFSQRLEPQAVDILPEFARPFVEIQSEALGLSAEEVEAMITTPLEADMLNGTPWMEEIRSTSIPGLSSIVLIFERGTDIMRARQVVQERLTEVFTLPNVTKSPVMINPVSSAGRFMAIGLRSDTLSLIDMSVLARWTVVPRLMGLPSVANVSIWGERRWQLHVQVDPEHLQKQNVTLLQVIKTAGNALWASPLTFLEASTPGTGGWIETANQRLGIRHVLPIQKAEDLAQVTIEGTASKRLGDVAAVVEDHQPLIGDALVREAPGLTLIVEKFPWADTADATEEVETALVGLRPALSGIEVDSTLFRPATYLELADNNFSRALFVGTLLVAGAFLTLLMTWHTAFVAIVAGLLSAIVAGAVFHVRGEPINMITLAGFLVALGVIIDDALVNAENIARRLRDARNGNGGHEENGGRSAAAIVVDAVFETRTPLLYATIIMALALMPVMVLSGVAGALFQPLATTYLLALVASTLVALTVTPALSLLLHRNGQPQAAEVPTEGMLRRLHAALFGWAARVPAPAMLTIGALVVAALAAVPFMRQESLLPDFKETDLVVRLEGSRGTSHVAMSRIMTLASRELRSIPGVRNVGGGLGRAVSSDKHTNVNAGELWVSLDPTADYDATAAAVKEVVAGYGGLNPEVLTYLQAKLREELSGTAESLVVRVYGEDLPTLRQKAEEVEQVLATVNGVVGARVHYPAEMPTVEIEVDVQRAMRHGLAPGEVRRTATALVSGIEVGSLFEAQKVFEVMVWGTPSTRHSLTSLENLLIDTPAGGHVRLKEVAHVRIRPAAAEIRRDAVARRIDVTASVRGRDVAAVAADIEHGLQQIEFPLEYRAELLGEYAVRRAAQQRVLAFAVTAAVGVLLLLQAFLRSWSLAAMVFLTLPAALSGGVLAAWITGGGLLSLGSLVGFLAVLGVAVRNALVLVGRYRDLEQQEGEAFGPALVRRGTEERAPLILMTAVAVALVFLPFAVGGNTAGLEIAHPMAIVALGGLVTSTIFSLVGVPAMCLLCGAVPAEADLDLAEEASATVATA